MKIYTNCSTLFLFIVLITAFSSCKKHDPDVVVTGESKIKVINAVQTETNQDLFVDGKKWSNPAIAFGETSSYLKISSGNRTIKFMGLSNISTESSLKFTPSLMYSIFLVNDRSGVREIVSYEDNLSNTETGKAKIKLINLSPFYATGINVSVQAGTQFVNGLAYKEVTNYFTVDADFNLRFNVVGSTNIKTIDKTNFVDGKIYTIWFSGTNTANLEAHIITDN